MLIFPTWKKNYLYFLLRLHHPELWDGEVGRGESCLLKSSSIHSQYIFNSYWCGQLIRTLDFLSEFHFLSDYWAHTYSIASTRAPTKRRIFIIGMNVTLSNPNLATKLISYKISYAFYTFLKLTWLIILTFAFQICMQLWLCRLSVAKSMKNNSSKTFNLNDGCSVFHIIA